MRYVNWSVVLVHIALWASGNMQGSLAIISCLWFVGVATGFALMLLK